MFKWFMLFVYVVLIAYILFRGIHCMRGFKNFIGKRRVIIPVSIIFIALCSTLILGGVLPDGAVKVVIKKFSNFWLGQFIYLLMFIVVADIIVLIYKLITRKKRPSYHGRPAIYALLFAAVIACAVGFSIYGLINAKHIKTNTYEVSVSKSCGDISELNIVLISDLHLGYNLGCEEMEKMVTKVNALNPDIIFIGGDIIDNQYKALDDPERLAAILSGLKSKYGTYGVYGNHDVDAVLIGGFSVTPKKEQMRDQLIVDFLDKCGIKMLEDESVLIDDSFYVAGRIDSEVPGIKNYTRESTEKLVEGLDKSKPIILLSHEPDELEENAKCGVDIQLSGHTHGGQFFPLTLSCPFTWENAWGHLEVDGMHSFVSSGIGVYGPFMRVGTDSEIMQIKVKFEG